MKIDNKEKFSKDEIQGYINDISCEASALSSLIYDTNLEEWEEHKIWGLAGLLENISNQLCEVNNCLDKLEDEKGQKLEEAGT
jgi:hypothetical protein